VLRFRRIAQRRRRVLIAQLEQLSYRGQVTAARRSTTDAATLIRDTLMALLCEDDQVAG
jgi:hypothetical protein